MLHPRNRWIRAAIFLKQWPSALPTSCVDFDTMPPSLPDLAGLAKAVKNKLKARIYDVL